MPGFISDCLLARELIRIGDGAIAAEDDANLRAHFAADYVFLGRGGALSFDQPEGCPRSESVTQVEPVRNVNRPDQSAISGGASWMSGRAIARYETKTKTAMVNTSAVGPSPKPRPLVLAGLLM
jgi:hypothetical protein